MRREKMKGVASAVWAVILVMVALVAILGTYAVTQLAVVPAVTYDGEFGSDAGIATTDLEGWFYNDFTETTDCNVTDDVLGDSGYVGCVFETNQRVNGSVTGINGSDFVFSLAFEIDGGPVQNLNIDGSLQNTGTLQAKDDMTIAETKIYTNEDDPVLIADLSSGITDSATEIDADTGVLQEGDYVLYQVIHAKNICPNAADGDDIFKAKLELTTDGDADEGYYTLESG